MTTGWEDVAWPAFRIRGIPPAAARTRCRAVVAVLRDPETRHAALADAAAGFRSMREREGIEAALVWSGRYQAWAKTGAAHRWREGNDYAAGYLRAYRRALRDVARAAMTETR
jgi:hypothetical protein